MLAAAASFDESGATCRDSASSHCASRSFAKASAVASNISTTGGSVALAIKTANGSAGDVTVELTATGLITFTSTTAADFDTLTEWLGAAALLAESAGESAVFQFGGNSYLFVQNGAQDILVELVGVTALGVGVLANTGTISGAGYVTIG